MNSCYKIFCVVFIVFLSGHCDALQCFHCFDSSNAKTCSSPKKITTNVKTCEETLPSMNDDDANIPMTKMIREISDIENGTFQCYFLSLYISDSEISIFRGCAKYGDPDTKFCIELNEKIRETNHDGQAQLCGFCNDDLCNSLVFDNKEKKFVNKTYQSRTMFNTPARSGFPEEISRDSGNVHSVSILILVVNVLLCNNIFHPR